LLGNQVFSTLNQPAISYMGNIIQYSFPVFGLGGRFGGVKRQKALRVTFFCLRGLESYGEFFRPGAVL
jgi:hypothetical protein